MWKNMWHVVWEEDTSIVTSSISMWEYPSWFWINETLKEIRESSELVFSNDIMISWLGTTEISTEFIPEELSEIINELASTKNKVFELLLVRVNWEEWHEIKLPFWWVLFSWDGWVEVNLWSDMVTHLRRSSFAVNKHWISPEIKKIDNNSSSFYVAKLGDDIIK